MKDHKIVFFTLVSGSSGNCAYIGTEEQGFLIDAGITAKALFHAFTEHQIPLSNIKGILLTHEHRDHIGGLGVLMRKLQIPVFATKGTWLGVTSMTSLGKLPDGLSYTISSESTIQLGNFHLTVVATSHDANEPVGYLFRCGKKSLGYVTDTGNLSPSAKELLRDATAYIIEANHDEEMLRKGPYPYYLKQRIASSSGHMSNNFCGEILRDLLTASCSHVILAHLSSENNTQQLAAETVLAMLSQHPFPLPNITIAPRYTSHIKIEL